MEHKTMYQLLTDLTEEVKSLHTKVDAIQAQSNNPVLPEFETDPEVIKLQESIQNVIKTKQVDELKKTLADLTGATPVETPIIEAEVKE